jgi:transcriptional regulator with XRE-family HTH domain
MAKLSDVRRRFPTGDAAAYAAAYAEAELAAAVGTLLHGLRTAAGIDPAELSARCGLDEDEILRAEEADVHLTVGHLDRVARALGVPVAVMGGGFRIVLGVPEPTPPSPPAQ